MKIVINAEYGGFSISEKAARWMAERGHAGAAAELREYDEQVADPSKRRHNREPCFFGYGYTYDGDGDGYVRTDPLLVAAVETLGEEANGSGACLKVVEIPDGVEWEIDEHDGYEHVAEVHRTWG